MLPAANLPGISGEFCLKFGKLTVPPPRPVKNQFDGNQNTKKNKICSHLLLLQKGSLSEIQIYVYYHTIGMRVILICFYNSSFLILYFLINDAFPYTCIEIN